MIFSRFARAFYLRTNDETATYFSKYLAEIAPRMVEMVRSDGGGEFLKGAFGALCTTEKIRQEFTTDDSPRYDGVAERQITTIEVTSLATWIQAAAKCLNDVFPHGESLWAEQAHWACHTLSRTAISANLILSPFMRCGLSLPQASLSQGKKAEQVAAESSKMPVPWSSPEPPP